MALPDRTAALPTLLLLLFLGSAPLLQADQEFLREEDAARRAVQKTGMTVLGSWALANFAASGYLMSRESGDRYYFHQMNVLWNVVNISIAGFGYAGALKGPAVPGFAGIVQEYRSFSKVLAVNAALDLGYIAAGLYLRHRSESSEAHAERLYGYGSSLILQGGFLLAFDLAMLAVNRGALGRFEASFPAGALLEAAPSPGGIVARLSWRG